MIFFVTGCIESFHFNNFWCSQLYKFIRMTKFLFQWTCEKERRPSVSEKNKLTFFVSLLDMVHISVSARGEHFD